MSLRIRKAKSSRIESLESMILMSGSSFDADVMQTSDPGMGGTALLNDAADDGTGQSTVSGTQSGEATDPGFPGSGGTDFLGSGPGGSTGGTFFPPDQLQDAAIGPIVDSAEPTSGPGQLFVSGDELEYLNVFWPVGMVGSEVPTTFVVQTLADTSLPEVYWQEVRIVGDEVWLLSVVEQTPESVSSPFEGSVGSGVTVGIPAILHIDGYEVREFRIGGSPDGTIPEYATAVTDVAEFLSLVGDDSTDILSDRSIAATEIDNESNGNGGSGAVGLSVGNQGGSAYQFGIASDRASGGHYVVAFADGDYSWHGTLPGEGAQLDDGQELTTSSPFGESFSVFTLPSPLEGMTQRTTLNLSTGIQQLDELYFQDVRIVGDEIWTLSVYEPAATATLGLEGHTSHGVAVDVPLAFHEAGYNVREFRIGGSAQNQLRENVEAVSDLDDYLDRIGSASTQQLYDHNDPTQFATQNGFAGFDGPSPSLASYFLRPDGETNSSWVQELDFTGIGPAESGGVAGLLPSEPEGDLTSGGDPGFGATNETIDNSGTLIFDDGESESSIANVSNSFEDASVGDTIGGAATGTGAATNALGNSDSGNSLSESASTDSNLAAALGASGQSGHSDYSVNTWNSGTENDDALVGGNGDDSFHASLGNNTLDGGAGLDTLFVYEGTSADFQIVRNIDGNITVTGRGLNDETVVNTLTDIERIVFNDRTVSLLNLPESTQSAPITGSEFPNDSTFIGGAEGDDNLIGTDGDDEFHDPAGSNRIDGGDGVDTLVIYDGIFKSNNALSGTGVGSTEGFTVERQSADLVVVEGTNSSGEQIRNELTNIEKIVFSNQDVFLDGGDFQTLAGTDDSEWLATDECTDFVHAGGGDDSIYAPFAGTRLIDGGDGSDTLVIYEGSRAEYELFDLRDSFGVYYVVGPGMNSLDIVNVEFIRFTDQILATSDIPPLPEEVGIGRAAVVLPPICIHI